MVETIAWGPFGVKATTTDGRVFQADQAVITLPLGVLKAGRVRFVPDLPKDKHTALEQLGITDAVKLFFHFEEPIFPEGIVELYVPGANPDEWWSSTRGHGVKARFSRPWLPATRPVSFWRCPRHKPCEMPWKPCGRRWVAPS